MDETEPSLEALARRAARGDRAALRAIYQRTAERLFREVIGPILPDRAACEEVLKETFVTVLERPSQLAAGEVFPWLVTIARNKALDRRRRWATESRFSALLAAETDALVERGNPEADAAAAQASRVTRERVEAVLARMNPRYAEALRIRLLEERAREACAHAMSITLNNFDVLLYRACKQFRVLYVETYGEEGEVG
jgi:RNA polymerase sigma-70 factor, ECF subfamily